jgi:hypothetical protein
MDLRSPNPFPNRRFFRRLGRLSSTLVACAKHLRRMQEELHDSVDPGSTPGRALISVVV